MPPPANLQVSLHAETLAMLRTEMAETMETMGFAVANNGANPNGANPNGAANALDGGIGGVGVPMALPADTLLATLARRLVHR